MKRCCKYDKASLLRAKQKYDDQMAKPVDCPKCFCAECAVEHKDREISALRKEEQALRPVQRIVADVRSNCEREPRSNPKRAAA